MRKNSLYQHKNSILPSIKKISTLENPVHFAKGITYRQNGYFLKHIVTKQKIDQIVRIFASKVKRNITTSAPVAFDIEGPDELKRNRWLKLKGVNIENTVEGLLLFLDIVMSIVMFFIATFISLLEDFRNGDQVSSTVIFIKSFALVVFVIRLVMAMITIDYQDGQIHEYIGDIIIKEFNNGSIILHIFSLVMNFISIITPQVQVVGIILQVASVLKLYLIKSNLRQLELTFINSSKKYYTWNLLRIIIFNIIFAHAVATILLAVAQINDHDKNWIAVKLVNSGILQSNAPWYQTYIWSYYWACTIMMTIGFGDISAVEFREALTIALVQIFTCIVLAYNINEVGSIISAMRRPSVELDRKIGIIRRMTKNDPIPQELTSKIEGYISHELQIRDQFQYDEHHSIICKLPEQLKNEYYQCASKMLFANLPFFRHLQGETMLSLILAFRGRVFYPSEVILNNRGGTKQVIIIRKGEVALTFFKPNCSMNGSVIQKIVVEDPNKPYMPTTSILTGTDLNYDIKAIGYTYGIVLPLDEFNCIIKKSNIDYYFYLSLRHKHSSQTNLYDYVRCQNCSRGQNTSFHTHVECPKLHYVPFRSMVLQKFIHQHQYAVREGRSVFNRRLKYFHPYCLRKSFFTKIEISLNISQEQYDEVAFESDTLFNFSNYFYDHNVDYMSGLSLKRRRRQAPVSKLFQVKSLKELAAEAEN